MPKFSSPPPYRPSRNTWRQSFYYQRVDSLPLHTNNAALMAAIISDNSAKPYLGMTPFGQDNWNNSYQAGLAAASYFVDSWPTGRPITRTNWAINMIDNQGRAYSSSPNPHLYWPDLRQQDATRANPIAQAILGLAEYQPSLTFGDRHSILWSEQTNELSESIGYIGNNPYCGAIATFNLQSYTLPLSVTGAPAGVCAARIPIAPFFFTYQDLLDCGTTGDLGHMVGWSNFNYGPNYVWPARLADGTLPSSIVPAGTVIRLKSDFNMSLLPSNATVGQPLRALARTLQKYGAMCYDRNFLESKIMVPSDPAWPQGANDLGVQLGTDFQFSSFEVVDLASVAGAANSIQTVVNVPEIYSVDGYAVRPGCAPVNVPTEITILGRHMNSATSVDFSGQLASTSFTIVSDSEIRCTTPPSLQGNSSVNVRNANGYTSEDFQFLSVNVSSGGGGKISGSGRIGLS